MSVILRPEFPDPPSNVPMGHNGKPATREELEFALANMRELGKSYRTQMQQHIRDINDNITRGRVLRSEFDRCAFEAEESIVLQLQDIIGTYDNWKTTNPDDTKRRYPPCVETPSVDDHDICLWCGARPDEPCNGREGNDAI